MFAWAVHDPVQSALHLVVQSALVGTETHWVVQWSLQQALQEAWQSVEVDVDVHEALQPALHRWSQSVVQSSAGGLEAQVVMHELSQLEVQFASAEALHWALHVCSSFAAHAFSHEFGAHWVVQLLFETTLQWDPASTLMSPHTETLLA